MVRVRVAFGCLRLNGEGELEEFKKTIAKNLGEYIIKELELQPQVTEKRLSWEFDLEVKNLKA